MTILGDATAPLDPVKSLCTHISIDYADQMILATLRGEERTSYWSRWTVTNKSNRPSGRDIDPRTLEAHCILIHLHCASGVKLLLLLLGDTLSILMDSSGLHLNCSEWRKTEQSKQQIGTFALAIRGTNFPDFPGTFPQCFPGIYRVPFATFVPPAIQN